LINIKNIIIFTSGVTYITQHHHGCYDVALIFDKTIYTAYQYCINKCRFNGFWAPW